MSLGLRSRIQKADQPNDDEKIFRLSDMDPEFVSMVHAGANRQKEFQVVKEDAPDGEDANTDPPPEPTAADKGEQDEQNANPDNGQDGEQADGDGQSATDKGDQGGNAEGGDTDLSAWLSDASENVETMLMDHNVQQSLDSPPANGSGAQDTSKQASEIGEAGAPPVVAGEETVQEAEELRKENEVLKEKLERALADVRKGKAELRKERARVARLQKGVGDSSVMLTGEVTTHGTQKEGVDDHSPSKGAFFGGRDIAAEVKN